jgi:hypothetical protein
MENRLPDCDKAQIEDTKLYNYLLNSSHPDGKSKARFYELIGYTLDKGELLRAELLRLACSGSVVNETINKAGRKFVVIGSINAPNGKTYPLLTVWVVESQPGTAPNHEPRLITAYPNN